MNYMLMAIKFLKMFIIILNKHYRLLNFTPIQATDLDY